METRLASWITFVAAFAASAACAQSLPLDRIRLPQGFTLELAARVPGAREMAFGDRGTLFVGSVDGAVHAVSFEDTGAKVRTVASGLREPVGVAFRDGALYVSAMSRILRLPDIESRPDHPPKPIVVSDKFPTDGHHGWKFIAFGPDGKLYVPVGAPCNVCEPDTDRYANIMRMNADGSGLEVYARGIRNTVGFDWDPATRELWFTNNGRDNMGDDTPPDTLNHARKAGLDFGFPYCHAGTIPDPEFGRTKSCRVRQTRTAAGCACRGARHALLHRQAVSGRVSRPDLHRRARIVESQHEGRLPRHPRACRRRPEAGGVRAVCRGLAGRSAGLRAARRCRGCTRRIVIDRRRYGGCHLSRALSRIARYVAASACQ